MQRKEGNKKLKNYNPFLIPMEFPFAYDAIHYQFQEVFGTSFRVLGNKLGETNTLISIYFIILETQFIILK